nr:site-2 protease family protein [bacterium]
MLFGGLSQLFTNPLGVLRSLLLVLPGLLLGLCAHEYAHAAVANKSGDDTARLMGRMTMNPIAHFDPVGMLALLLLGFGWAKPVPVNPARVGSNAKGSRRKWLFLVAVAGICTNIIIAFVLYFVWVTLRYFLVVPMPTMGGTAYTLISALLDILNYAISINLVLAVFNLIPVPPLDGSRMLREMIGYTPKWYEWVERYGMFILLALMFLNIASIWINFGTGLIIEGFEFLGSLWVKFLGLF